MVSLLCDFSHVYSIYFLLKMIYGIIHICMVSLLCGFLCGGSKQNFLQKPFHRTRTGLVFQFSSFEHFLRYLLVLTRKKYYFHSLWTGWLSVEKNQVPLKCIMHHHTFIKVRFSIPSNVYVFQRCFPPYFCVFLRLCILELSVIWHHHFFNLSYLCTNYFLLEVVQSVDEIMSLQHHVSFSASSEAVNREHEWMKTTN